MNYKLVAVALAFMIIAPVVYFVVLKDDKPEKGADSGPETRVDNVIDVVVDDDDEDEDEEWKYVPTEMRLTGGLLYFVSQPDAVEYEISVNDVVVGTTTGDVFDLSAVASLSESSWRNPAANPPVYNIAVTAIDADGEPVGDVQEFTHKSEIIVTEIASTLHRWKLGNTARFNEIYDMDRQQAVRAEIDDLIAEYGHGYTPQNPLVIRNPFGTNELGLYIYFKTAENCSVTYTVVAPATADFTRIVNGGAYGKVHEFQVMGLVHQKLCDIVFDIKTSGGAQTSSSFKVNGLCSSAAPDLTIREIDAANADKITDGLIAVFEDSQVRFNVLLYDNNGIKRGYITSGLAHRIIIDDDGNWIYDGTRNKVVVTNRLGEVIRIYPTPDYTNHHDIILGKNNDILRLVNGDGQIEDLIMSIDRDTGSTTMTNLRDFFPGYDFNRNGKDWFHANSLSIVPESSGIFSLLVSSRELSAVIKIYDFYGKTQEPSLDWIMTDNMNLTQYAPRLIKINGVPNLGQHTITYIKHDDVDPDKYYVHLFNNMYRYSSSNTSYTDNDYNFDGLNGAPYAWGTMSSMDIYLIDESAGTCELTQTISVAFTRFQGSSDIYDGNYIIGSSYSKYIYEYDDQGNLLIKYEFGVGLTVPAGSTVNFYRAIKYNI